MASQEKPELSLSEEHYQVVKVLCEDIDFALSSSRRNPNGALKQLEWLAEKKNRLISDKHTRNMRYNAIIELEERRKKDHDTIEIGKMINEWYKTLEENSNDVK